MQNLRIAAVAGAAAKMGRPVFGTVTRSAQQHWFEYRMSNNRQNKLLRKRSHLVSYSEGEAKFPPQNIAGQRRQKYSVSKTKTELGLG